MPVETVQCPSCGAPLPVEEGWKSLFCGHCGASLSITLGSSGHVMAALSEIKADTSILACQAALGRIEEKLKAERGQLDLLARKEMNLQHQIAEMEANPVIVGDNFTRILAMIFGLAAIAIGFIVPIVVLINGEANYSSMLLWVAGFWLVGGFLVYAAIASRAADDLIANLESEILKVNNQAQDVIKRISRIEGQRGPIAAKIDHLTAQL